MCHSILRSLSPHERFGDEFLQDWNLPFTYVFRNFRDVFIERPGRPHKKDDGTNGAVNRLGSGDHPVGPFSQIDRLRGREQTDCHGMAQQAGHVHGRHGGVGSQTDHIPVELLCRKRMD
jgi:hypothetical protein